MTKGCPTSGQAALISFQHQSTALKGEGERRYWLNIAPGIRRDIEPRGKALIVQFCRDRRIDRGNHVCDDQESADARCTPQHVVGVCVVVGIAKERVGNIGLAAVSTRL